jgi:hypothetical protein
MIAAPKSRTAELPDRMCAATHPRARPLQQRGAELAAISRADVPTLPVPTEAPGQTEDELEVIRGETLGRSLKLSQFERRGPPPSAGCSARVGLEQVSRIYLQGGCQSLQHAEGRRTSARLQSSYELRCDTDGLRELVLRKPLRLAQLSESLSQT